MAFSMVLLYDGLPVYQRAQWVILTTMLSISGSSNTVDARNIPPVYCCHRYCHHRRYSNSLLFEPACVTATCTSESSGLTRKQIRLMRDRFCVPGVAVFFVLSGVGTDVHGRPVTAAKRYYRTQSCDPILSLSLSLLVLGLFPMPALQP